MEKKTVLVPIDGSAFSQQVLSQLTQFASPEGAKLILLRVAKAGAHTIRKEEGGEGSLPLVVGGTFGLMSMPLSKPDANFETTESPEGTVYESQMEERTVQAIVDSLRPVRKTLEGQGYEVESVGLLGEPATRIVEYLNDMHVDLVAMTTHCRTPFGRVFLGSVAQYVIHHAAVPIFLVRPCTTGS
jgi:nucleotide-binding universal stress UspA family protein